MRIVIQRVERASVVVDGQVVGEITEPGLLILVGVREDDGLAEIEKMCRKISQLRLLEGEKSLLEADAPVLLVSQFTLYGEVKKGRRPSFTHAAAGEVAEPIFNQLVQAVRDLGIRVETGQFGAMMKIEMVADGPFTICYET